MLQKILRCFKVCEIKERAKRIKRIRDYRDRIWQDGGTILIKYK